MSAQRRSVCATLCSAEDLSPPWWFIKLLLTCCLSALVHVCSLVPAGNGREIGRLSLIPEHLCGRSPMEDTTLPELPHRSTLLPNLKGRHRWLRPRVGRPCLAELLCSDFGVYSTSGEPLSTSMLSEGTCSDLSQGGVPWTSTISVWVSYATGRGEPPERPQPSGPEVSGNRGTGHCFDPRSEKGIDTN